MSRPSDYLLCCQLGNRCFTRINELKLVFPFVLLLYIQHITMKDLGHSTTSRTEISEELE